MLRRCLLTSTMIMVANEKKTFAPLNAVGRILVNHNNALVSVVLSPTVLTESA